MKLVMYRGDSPEFELTCKKRDGTPLDISTGELFFTAKASTRLTDEYATFQKTNGDGISIVNGPEGLALVTLDPEDTEGIVAPVYLYWDLQYVAPSGRPATLVGGDLLVKADVSRSTE